MSSAKSWLKIVLVLIVLLMLGMCAIAGAGVYFVSQHVSTSTVSSGSALKQFDEMKAQFKGQMPLLEIDSRDRVKRLRDLSELPSAPTRATTLGIMIWDPDDERLVNLKLPLWILEMGRQHVDIGTGPDGFDLRRLQLDVKEIARVGPLLIADVHTDSGERVLLWTQ
ncbi:MAG: hypothetical protein HQ485_15305 [Acidobacteria bacterium]|jgi:hypothetical protein|nr:hypothetical protein [Acidobacteriota bacterium]